MAGGSQNTVSLRPTTKDPAYYTADRGYILIIVGTVFAVLEVIAFCLRAYARRLMRLPLSWGDALVAFALVSNLALIGLIISSVTYAGVGKHTIVAYQQGYDVRWGSLNGLILVPVIYMVSLTASKAAILNLFLHIFTIGIERRITQALAVVVVLFGFSSIFGLIFQCNPVSDTWRTFNRPNCLNTQDIFKYSCIPNLVTDVIMLGLPMPTIWRLKAPKRVKVGVAIMLLMATIGIVGSVIRTVGFFKNDRIFKDPRWETVDLEVYTLIEGGTYLIAACFSSYRVLGRYFKSERLLRILARCRLVSRRYASRGFVQVEETSESGGEVKLKNKAVRGFDSIMLSEIERGESTERKSQGADD